MWLTRRDWLALAVAASPNRAAAELPRYEALALGGYDAVSYFLPGGPSAGSADVEWSWRGRVWRFSRSANRNAFQRAPVTYAPRLGGFDAAEVAAGRLVDTDPLIFSLLDGRLYLFRDAERRKRVLTAPELVSQAERLWPSLRTLTDGTAPD